MAARLDDAASADSAADSSTMMMVDALPVDAAPQPDAPLPMPMIVQQAGNILTNASSISATLPALPGSGRVLVMVGAAIDGALDSVTGGGATWTRATSSLDNTNIEIWYGVSNGSSSTITIARAANNGTIFLAVSEWTNLATTATLDIARSTSGAGTTASAGTLTTANARDLIVFAVSAQAPNTFGTPSQGPWM